jgi:hypothetical protein
MVNSLEDIRERARHVERRVALTWGPPYDKLERDLIRHVRALDLAGCDAFKQGKSCGVCDEINRATSDEEYVEYRGYVDPEDVGSNLKARIARLRGKAQESP